MNFPALLRLVPLLLVGLLTACEEPGTGLQTGAARQTPVPRTSAPARDLGGLTSVASRDLPREGRQTLRLIRAGGPFPYRQDGSAFGNRERLLPPRPSGGYREYTVPTPGEDDRGARRIVCAAGAPDARPAAECYYTADHYASFRRIAP